MSMDWFPGVRCGPFVFGAKLPELTDLSLTLLEPSCEGADWQTFRVGDDDARVSVEDGVVVSVECAKSVRYLGGDELVGAAIKSLPQILGTNIHLEKDWGDGSAMYEAHGLGLTIWVEHERVESVTVEPTDGLDSRRGEHSFG